MTDSTAVDGEATAGRHPEGVQAPAARVGSVANPRRLRLGATGAPLPAAAGKAAQTAA